MLCRKRDMYDHENVFAKLLRHEIPCNTVLETKHVLAFYDINPQAPIHVLIIPKGAYSHAQACYTKATAEERLEFGDMLGRLPEHLGLSSFRLISNQGKEAGQEVPHYHVHLLGGKSLGTMLV